MPEREWKNRVWQEAFEKHYAEMRLRARSLTSGPFQSKLDASAIAESALESFASECEKRQLDFSEDERANNRLRAFLYCITWRKWRAHWQHITTQRGDLRREMPLQDTDWSGDHEPVLKEVYFNEACEQLHNLLQKVKLKRATDFGVDPKADRFCDACFDMLLSGKINRVELRRATGVKKKFADEMIAALLHTLHSEYPDIADDIGRTSLGTDTSADKEGS